MGGRAFSSSIDHRLLPIVADLNVNASSRLCAA
jgi:hypothetical protein